MPCQFFLVATLTVSPPHLEKPTYLQLGELSSPEFAEILSPRKPSKEF